MNKIYITKEVKEALSRYLSEYLRYADFAQAKSWLESQGEKSIFNVREIPDCFHRVTWSLAYVRHDDGVDENDKLLLVPFQKHYKDLCNAERKISFSLTKRSGKRFLNLLEILMDTGIPFIEHEWVYVFYPETDFLDTIENLFETIVQQRNLPCYYYILARDMNNTRDYLIKQEMLRSKYVTK